MKSCRMVSMVLFAVFVLRLVLGLILRLVLALVLRLVFILIGVFHFEVPPSYDLRISAVIAYPDFQLLSFGRKSSAAR